MLVEGLSNRPHDVFQFSGSFPCSFLLFLKLLVYFWTCLRKSPSRNLCILFNLYLINLLLVLFWKLHVSLFVSSLHLLFLHFLTSFLIFVWLKMIDFYLLIMSLIYHCVSIILEIHILILFLVRFVVHHILLLHLRLFKISWKSCFVIRLFLLTISIVFFNVFALIIHFHW